MFTVNYNHGGILYCRKMSVRDDGFVNEEDFREFRNYCKFKQLLDKERGLSGGGSVAGGASKGKVSATRISSDRSSSRRSHASSGRSRSRRREEERSPRRRHRDVSRPSRRRRSRSGRRSRSRSRTSRRESVRRRSVERRGRGGSSTRRAMGDSSKGMSSPSVRGIPSMCGGVSRGVPEIVVASHPCGDSVGSHPCGDSVGSHPCGDSVCSHPGGDSVDVPGVGPRKMERTTGSDGVQRRGQATVVPGKERPTLAEVVKKAAQQEVTRGDENRYAMKKTVPGTCPLRNCPAYPKDMKRHVLEEHLPSCFNAQRRGQEMAAERMDALRFLLFLSGHPGDFDSALRRCNSKRRFLLGARLEREIIEVAKELCVYEGEPVPEAFHLFPVNHPSLLFHWRVACLLLNDISVNSQRRFHEWVWKGRRTDRVVERVAKVDSKDSPVKMVSKQVAKPVEKENGQIVMMEQKRLEEENSVVAEIDKMMVEELDLEEDRPRLDWIGETEEFETGVRDLVLSEPRMEVETERDSRGSEKEKGDDWKLAGSDGRHH